MARLNTFVLILPLLVSLVYGVTSPACQLSAAPAQKKLSNVCYAYTNVTGRPAGILYASQKQGNYAFVCLESSVGVLNTSSFPPQLLHEIPLPIEAGFLIRLNGDGTHLYVADEYGAYIIDTARAISSGNTSAIIGSLNGTTATQNPGHEAFYVAVTTDETFAFVAQEYGSGDRGGNIDVFKLQKSSKPESVSGTPVGFITLSRANGAVPGLTLAPGGRRLYAVSEIMSQTNLTGSLYTLNVSKLETNPSAALISNVAAGCEPVRALPSRDGGIIWVTARQSNHLLAFNGSKLLADPGNALIASVQVGTLPVGLAFVKGETQILTADSNRANYANATSGIPVVDVKAVLDGKGDAAVLGRVPTGVFPRDIALSRDRRTVLVTDYISSQVQAIEVASLP